MKKYILGVFFLLGFLFVSLISNVNVVDAALSHTTPIEHDSYDNRKINIELSGINLRTNVIELTEVVACEAGSEDCEEFTLDDDSKKFLRKLEGSNRKYSGFIVPDSMVLKLDYTITSEDDGIKSFLVETFQSQNSNVTDLAKYYFEYELVTLNQRITINPDGNGNPLHMYDGIQYSAVRKLTIGLDLYQEELSKYPKQVYVCEVTNESKIIHCGEYSSQSETVEYYLTSYGDGKKYLKVYLVRFGNIIGDTTNLEQELKDEAEEIAKDIYLDSIGPVITIENGNWIFVDSGEKYIEQNATCKDAVFTGDKCIVTNDFAIVGIDYSSDNYQIITYEAKDKLGNISYSMVKIKVNQEVKDNSLVVWLIVAGSIMVVTGGILTYVLLKNAEKKKKMSYI